MSRTVRGRICPVLFTLAALAPGGSAGAETYNVTTTADSGTGSLRWAIDQANANPGPDRIAFRIAPLDSPATIVILSPLPKLESDVTVSGNTGTDGRRLLAIHGGVMTGSPHVGLRLGDRCVVGGIVVNGFRDGGAGVGIAMEGDGGKVHNTYVGTDLSGTEAVGNDVGIRVTGDANLVGHEVGDIRFPTIVSGNGIGVLVEPAGAVPSGNVIQQTWIGLGQAGLYVPNESHGVRIDDARGTHIGGPAGWQRNRIATNGGVGIVVAGPLSQGNVLEGNAMWANGGLAIDLGDDGVTPNDAGDADRGPNRGQNFPVITTAAWAGDRAEIRGSLSSAPSRAYRLEFFATASPDGSGHGEGDHFLGAASVTTGATGIATFTVPVYGVDSFFRYVSATATDAAGNTSELSPVVTVSGALPLRATFVVNATDAARTGFCNPARCSISEAIDRANATPNGPFPDRIAFGIPGAGPHVIHTGSDVPPDITDQVEIDGYTQPGSSPNTRPVGAGGLDSVLMVEIACSPTIRTAILSINGGSSVIRGLAIHSCGSAIFLKSDRNVIEGNYLGTTATGGVPPAEGGIGVVVQGSSNRIGGTTAAARNLISGNSTGISITNTFTGSPPVTGNVVQGNLIGTTRDGHSARTNTLSGVDIHGMRPVTGNVIGGTEPGAGNVISGNTSSGLANCFGILLGGASGGAAAANRIEGNFIGTDAEGDTTLPNRTGIGVSFGAAGTIIGGSDPRSGNVISGNIGSGVFLYLGSTDTTVEGNWIGTRSGAIGTVPNGRDGVTLFSDSRSNRIVGNTIRWNGEAGVAVFDTSTSEIARNALFGNRLLGIDLGGDGVTPNDAGDGDGGPNHGQNYPVLIAATTTTVSGSFKGAPSTAVRLEFFASQVIDPSGFGEGARFVGTRVVLTDTAGRAVFTATFAGPVLPNDWVTATATVDGETSEFSRGVRVP